MKDLKVPGILIGGKLISAKDGIPIDKVTAASEAIAELEDRARVVVEFGFNPTEVLDSLGIDVVPVIKKPKQPNAAKQAALIRKTEGKLPPVGGWKGPSKKSPRTRSRTHVTMLERPELWGKEIAKAKTYGLYPVSWKPLHATIQAFKGQSVDSNKVGKLLYQRGFVKGRKGGQAMARSLLNYMVKDPTAKKSFVQGYEKIGNKLRVLLRSDPTNLDPDKLTKSPSETLRHAQQLLEGGTGVTVRGEFRATE